MKRDRHPGKFRRRDLWLLLVPVLLALGVYWAGRWIETSNEKPETRGNPSLRYAYGTVVEFNGEEYREKQDVTVVLLLGVDGAQTDRAQTGFRSGGQADFLRLLVIDHGEKKISQIGIDRDTMTPITVLGVLGEKSGVRNAQIALSHAFGDGGAQSCELTAEAVSNLCFGISIDFYCALNMDGIPALNDLLGGVKVTLPEDMTNLDPEMKAGQTLTLNGVQAEYLVRSRQNVGDGTNTARMERQEIYLSAAAAQMHAQLGTDQEFIGRMYDELQPYLVTNASRGRLINEAWRAKDYQRMERIYPAGTHTASAAGLAQFYVDEEALQALMMQMLFVKME